MKHSRQASNTTHITRDASGFVHMVWGDSGRSLSEGALYRRARVLPDGSVSLDTDILDLAPHKGNWTAVTGEPVAARNHGSESLILAEARITYRAQAFHTDRVTVETRATRIGTSSFTLEHRLTAQAPDGQPRLIAVSDSVLVRYDYATERPTALSAEDIAAIEAFEGESLRRP